jgi:rhodanese-related sulfurtransferase
MRRHFVRVAIIVLASLILAVSLRFSFIRQSLKGELILRPDLEKTTVEGGSQGTISLAEAKRRFDDKEALFVDARPRLFYQVGHIQGAVSLPREDYEKRPDAAILSQYRERKLVLYCSGKDCPDSALLAAYLAKEGFQSIEIFEGGWPEWKSAGFPIQKGSYPTP